MKTPFKQRFLFAMVGLTTFHSHAATLDYRWDFSGSSGVPTVTSGGGTLTAVVNGAGTSQFTAPGSSGQASDFAFNVDNFYTSGVGTNGNVASTAAADVLTGYGSPTTTGTLNSFTVTMWLNLTSGDLAAGKFPRLLQTGAGTGDNTANSLSLLLNAGKLELGVNTFKANTTPGSLMTVPALASNVGGWMFLAVTYDGTTTSITSTNNSTLYGTTNNAVAFSGTTTSSVAVSTSGTIVTATAGVSPGPLVIGTAANVYLGNQSAGGRGLTGKIDDVRVYDGQLTLAELEAVRLQGAPPPPPGGTPYFWKGTASSNWTGNNWSSSLTGTPLATPPNNGTAAMTFAATSPANMDATVFGTNWNVAALNFNDNSFATVNGAMSIGGTHNLTVGGAGISLSSGANQVTLNSTGQVILAAAQTWNNLSSSPFEVASQVSGAFKLTTGGTGVTTLSGANTYSGGTAVEGGTLKVGNTLALGNVASATTVAATLDLNGFSPTVGSLLGSGTITSSVDGTAVLTVNGPDSTSFLGPINNGDASTKIVGLVKNGTGNLSLGANGSFTGDITVTQGTLTGSFAIYGGNASSSFGNLQNGGRIITVAPAATLSLASNNVFASQYTNFANLPEVILNASTMTANNYNAIGKVTMSGGTLANTSASASTTYRGYQFKGDITATGAAASFITNTTIGNHLNTNTLFTVDAGSSLTVSTALFDQSLNFVSAPDVPLTGGFTKTGPGTLTLTAANSYTGPTTLSEGSLSLGSANSLSDVAPFAVTDTANSTLVLNFVGTDNVTDFIVNGVSGGGGTHGAIGSGANHQYAWISGTGLIGTPVTDPYPAWIATYYPVANDPDAAKTADPDKDGLTNLQEFALDSLPNSGAASGKTRSGVETVGAGKALVLTFPVRDGAVFSGTAPASATLTADKLTYNVYGSHNLGTFDQPVSEIPVSSAGLPTLDTGWSYRTFRLDGDVSGAIPRGFLRTGVVEAP